MEGEDARIILDLDQGNLEGLPLTDLLRKFVEEASRTGATRYRTKAQARKGNQLGQPICVDININQTEDKQDKQSGRKPCATMEIQQITITLDVRANDGGDGLTVGEKKQAGNTSLKTAKAKKKEKDKPENNKQLVKTLSGRKLATSGDKLNKLRQTLSLIDVRTSFKKEGKEDKIRKDEQYGKKKSSKTSNDLKQEDTDGDSNSTKPHLFSENFASESYWNSKSSGEEKLPLLNEPWLLPELTSTELAVQQKKAPKRGVAQEGNAITIPEMFFEAGEKYSNHPAYFTKSCVTQTWQYITYADLCTLVRRVSNGLIALGMPPRARTAILCSNRLEWVIFYLASMSVGAVPAGIPTAAVETDVIRMLALTQASVVLVEKREQSDILLAHRHAFPSLRHIILVEGPAPSYPPSCAFMWRQFMFRGAQASREKSGELDCRLKNLQATNLAALAFTSGTTGPAKCVMLSHVNLLFSARTFADLLTVAECDSIVSFLPLSHIMEQVLAIHLPIATGCRIYFAESVGKLHPNMRDIQPTLVFAPPDLWLKVFRAVQAKVPTSAEGSAINPHTLTTLWARMGFGRLRFALCGYGHLPEEVGELLRQLHLSVYEGYGQSETCGLISMSYPGNAHVGAVGKPPPNVRIMVDPDGQLLVKGDNIFMGYLAESKKQEFVLQDGWWGTGDQGSVDERGVVRLIGRRVELIRLLDGKWIHPAKIESSLKMAPAINHAVVFGHQMPYLTAFICLDPFYMAQLSKEKGVSASALYKPPHINDITASIQRHVIAVNKYLQRSCPALKRFTVLRKQFSLDKGELTAAMQIRRLTVEQNYLKDIKKMYADQQQAAAVGQSYSPQASIINGKSFLERNEAKVNIEDASLPSRVRSPRPGHLMNQNKLPQNSIDKHLSVVEHHRDPRRGTTNFYNLLKQGHLDLQLDNEPGAVEPESKGKEKEKEEKEEISSEYQSSAPPQPQEETKKQEPTTSGSFEVSLAKGRPPCDEGVEHKNMDTPSDKGDGEEGKKSQLEGGKVSGDGLVETKPNVAEQQPQHLSEEKKVPERLTQKEEERRPQPKELPTTTSGKVDIKSTVAMFQMLASNQTSVPASKQPARQQNPLI